LSKKKAKNQKREHLISHHREKREDGRLRGQSEIEIQKGHRLAKSDYSDSGGDKGQGEGGKNRIRTAARLRVF